MYYGHVIEVSCYLHNLFISLITLLLQVKNFILLGDVHKSIYFLSWKEQGSQLSLLAKDFGSLDCFATEFLIDGSTLSLIVSDEQKNVQVSTFLLWAIIHVTLIVCFVVFFYAPWGIVHEGLNESLSVLMPTYAYFMHV